METDHELPVFRYHPDPVRTGVIKKNLTACPVCGRTRAYVYTGPFYSAVDVSGICPWCIASGRAAATYGGKFMDPWTSEPASAESMDEVAHRTPGYVSWQDDPWLSHCGECCAFIDYVGWQDVEPLAAELADDIARFEQETDFGDDGLRSVLHKNGDVVGYLFRCTVCGLHRLHVDVS